MIRRLTSLLSTILGLALALEPFTSACPVPGPVPHATRISACDVDALAVRRLFEAGMARARPGYRAVRSHVIHDIAPASPFVPKRHARPARGLIRVMPDFAAGSAIIPAQASSRRTPLTPGDLDVSDDIASAVDRYARIHNRLVELEPRSMIAVPETFRERIAESFRRTLRRSGIPVDILFLDDSDHRLGGRPAVTLYNRIYLSRSISIPELLGYVAHEGEHLMDADEYLAVQSEIDLIRRAKALAVALRAPSAETTPAEAAALADTLEYWALTLERRLATAALQATEAGRTFLGRHQLGQLDGAPERYLRTTAAAYASDGPLSPQSSARTTRRLASVLQRRPTNEALKQWVFAELMEANRAHLRSLTDRINAEISDWIEEATAWPGQSEEEKKFFAASGAHDFVSFAVWAKRQLSERNGPARAEFERALLRFLRHLVRHGLQYRSGAYHLSGVLTRTQTNCVGGTLLLRALAQRCGVSIGVIEVVEIRAGPQQHHFANIVEGPEGVRMLDWTNATDADPNFVRIGARVDGHYRLITRDEYLGAKVAGLTDPQIEATLLMWAAHDFESEGDLESAAATEQQALSLNPENASLYNNMASFLIGLGQSDEALQALNRAIELDPKEVAAYLNRALIHRDREHFDLAQSDLAKALSLEPDNFQIYIVRASIRDTAGDPDGAVQDFQKAIELNTSESSPYFHLGRFYFRQGQEGQKPESLAAAERYLSMAIERAPEKASYYEDRSEIYFALGEPAKARADELKALELRKTGAADVSLADATIARFILGTLPVEPAERWNEFLKGVDASDLHEIIQQPRARVLQRLVVMAKGILNQKARESAAHELRMILGRSLKGKQPAIFDDSLRQWSKEARLRMLQFWVSTQVAAERDGRVDVRAWVTAARALRTGFSVPFTQQELASLSEADLAIVQDCIREQIFFSAGEFVHLKPTADGKVSGIIAPIGNSPWFEETYLGVPIRATEVESTLTSETIAYKHYAFINTLPCLTRANEEFTHIMSGTSAAWSQLGDLFRAFRISQDIYRDLAGTEFARRCELRVIKDRIYASLKSGGAIDEADDVGVLEANLRPEAYFRTRFWSKPKYRSQQNAATVLRFMARFGATIELAEDLLKDGEEAQATAVLARFMTSEGAENDSIEQWLIRTCLIDVGGFADARDLNVAIFSAREGPASEGLKILKSIYAKLFWPDSERSAELRSTAADTERGAFPALRHKALRVPLQNVLAQLPSTPAAIDKAIAQFERTLRVMEHHTTLSEGDFDEVLMALNVHLVPDGFVLKKQSETSSNRRWALFRLKGAPRRHDTDQGPVTTQWVVPVGQKESDSVSRIDGWKTAGTDRIFFSAAEVASLLDRRTSAVAPDQESMADGTVILDSAIERWLATVDPRKAAAAIQTFVTGVEVEMERRRRMTSYAFLRSDDAALLHDIAYLAAANTVPPQFAFAYLAQQARHGQASAWSVLGRLMLGRSLAPTNGTRDFVQWVNRRTEERRRIAEALQNASTSPQGGLAEHIRSALNAAESEWQAAFGVAKPRDSITVHRFSQTDEPSRPAPAPAPLLPKSRLISLSA